MGWHMKAYYDINQSDFDEFLKEHNLNRDKWEDAVEIAILYKKERLLLDDSVFLLYYWNNDCQLHELYEIYSVSFIRDDVRFCNARYHKALEENVGKSFPACLKNICWTLRTREDALDIARNLTTFFHDDEVLMYFAEWLTTTAKYCSTYDLSY